MFGNEEAWWAALGIDPLALAARLWAASLALGIKYTYERRGPRRPFRGRKKAAKVRAPMRTMHGF